MNKNYVKKNNNNKPRPKRNNNGKRRRRNNRRNYITRNYGPKPRNVISAPAATTQVVSSGGNKRPYRLVHTEYVGTVMGTVAYSVRTYQINPGLIIFPWIAQMAALYDCYTVSQMRFRFVNSATTGVSGTVALGFDYDGYDTPPASLQAFSQLGDVAISSSWTRASLALSRRDLASRGQLYVRSAVVTGDLKTYDLGELYVVTDGQPSTAKVGDIYIDYDFTFTKPHFSSAAASMDFYLGQTAGSLSNIIGQNDDYPFGTDTSTFQQATTPLSTFTWRSATQYQFLFANPGSYMMVITITGTGLATVQATDITFAPTTGGVRESFFSNANGAATNTITCLHVTVNSPSTAVVFTWVGADWATLTEVAILVYKTESGLNYITV